MTAATSMPDGIKWWPLARVEKWEAETLRELKHEFNLTQEPNHYTLDYLKKKYGAEPTSVLETEGNYLTNVGRVRVADLTVGNGTPKQLVSPYAGTGVGDASTLATQANIQGQTALQATTNLLYKPLDSTPTSGTVAGSTSGVITAQTTYQTGDANFAWNEWCLTVATATSVSSSSFATATTSGIMLNRAVTSLGTKVSTAVWVLQVTVTLS